MKRKIRITENDLHRIVENAVYQVLAEQNNRVDEGWKGLAMAGMMGAASLFGGQKANAQNVAPQDTIQTTQTQQPQAQNQKTSFTMQELQQMFPQAYKDKDKNPKVWQKNQTKYVGNLPNGKTSLVGKIAASHGQNPWQALVDRYVSTFELSDFDI